MKLCYVPPLLGRLLLWLLSYSYCPCVKTQLTGIIKVGVASSLTGEYADWVDAINGYRLWESTANAAGGLYIRDASDSTHQYAVQLFIRDDHSAEGEHATAIKALLEEDRVHVVLGASPVFAEQESVAVNAAGRLNFHCCASAASIYARDQGNVFGMLADSWLYPYMLFSEFRANNVYKLAVVYRGNILESRYACAGAMQRAKDQLLSVVLEVPYSNGTDATLAGIADEVAASSAEALVVCGLSSESATLVQLLDKRRKALKAMVFTEGAYAREWNAKLGNLSSAALSFAHWSPDLTGKDVFWGDSTTYANKYANAFQREATYIAAAASATGYVLQSVLKDLFKPCTLTPQALADPAALFFTDDAINCTDNNNNGHARLVAALAVAHVDTFFGTLSFDKYRQNQGYYPVTLQTYETIENLQRVYKPSLVLPLHSATRPLLLPQPNRYAAICQPGTYRGSDDFLPCTPCPLGQFQEFTGRASCELCPRDYYANDTGMADCLACPANTITVQRGSTNLTDCACKVGYFARAGLPGLACEACPSNADCEGGTAMPSPLPGFYAERDAPFTMYPCNPGSVCTGNFTCAEGYRGRFCSYCAKGYYRFLGNCVSCPRDSSMVLGYIVVLAAVWLVINVSFARTVENLLIIINFCQLISIVVGFSLNWPQRLYQVMSISSILSFEMDSLQPSCLVPSWSFAHNLAVQLLLPIVMAVFVALWCGVTASIFAIKQMLMNRSAKAAMHRKLVSEAPWKQVMWAILDVPADKRELRDVLIQRCAIPLNFLSIGYLVLLKYCLSAFQCTTVNGVKYIAAAPDELCYTPAHWYLMLLGTAGLLTYSFGFLCLYGHVLRVLHKRRALGSRVPLLLYGWMYERYEAQYYWYELVPTLQRTGFVLVALFVSDPALQAVLCMLIAWCVIMFDIRTTAYVDKEIQTLQTLADGVIGAVLVAGLLFYNPLSHPTIVRAVEYVLLAAVLIALCSAAISVIECLAISVVTLWLMSKHRPVAFKMGQRIRGYRHMYEVFGPIFLFNWLRRCSEEELEVWHRFCMILNDYIHPTSEVSYLSLKKVGRFWRYLLSNFPETIDYLLSVSPEERNHFNAFIEVLYDHFFDTADQHRYQVYYFVDDKFKAAFAQWLSSCTEEEREMCQKVMKTALVKAKGTEAAMELSAAMSRHSNALVRAATVYSATQAFQSVLSNADSSQRGSAPRAGKHARRSAHFQDAGPLEQGGESGGATSGSGNDRQCSQEIEAEEAKRCSREMLGTGTSLTDKVLEVAAAKAASQGDMGMTRAASPMVPAASSGAVNGEVGAQTAGGAPRPLSAQAAAAPGPDGGSGCASAEQPVREAKPEKPVPANARPLLPPLTPAALAGGASPAPFQRLSYADVVPLFARHSVGDEIAAIRQLAAAPRPPSSSNTGAASGPGGNRDAAACAYRHQSSNGRKHESKDGFVRFQLGSQEVEAGEPSSGCDGNAPRHTASNYTGLGIRQESGGTAAQCHAANGGLEDGGMGEITTPRSQEIVPLPVPRAFSTSRSGVAPSSIRRRGTPPLEGRVPPPQQDSAWQADKQ